jgi:hypothetical protein
VGAPHRTPTHTPARVAQQTPNQNPAARSSSPSLARTLPFEHGSHNVSRWMTWLPISLKNAAKCDKWYQLQNHSITESLNANGAREKPPTAIPVHAVSLSVEQKPNPQKSLGLSRLASVQQCAHRDGGRVVTPNSTRHTVDSWVIHKSLYSRSLRRGGPHSLPRRKGRDQQAKRQTFTCC